MHLSSSPVYLVNHTATMYMEAELGVVAALEPSRKSGFQTLMHAAVHVTVFF